MEAFIRCYTRMVNTVSLRQPSGRPYPRQCKGVLDCLEYHVFDPAGCVTILRGVIDALCCCAPKGPDPCWWYLLKGSRATSLKLNTSNFSSSSLHVTQTRTRVMADADAWPTLLFNIRHVLPSLFHWRTYEAPKL
jgi:hypothetical protein